MHHHPNAAPWYWQAAQAVLDQAQVPALYGITHHGTTSAALMHTGTEGRLIVMVGVNIAGRLVDTRPAPRKLEHLTRWEQARAQVADLFTEAGFPTPRPTRMGLVVEVPEHLGSPARVHLDRAGLGRYNARIGDHPELVAHIDGRMEVATSTGYTLVSAAGTHRGRFGTEHEAARAFATDCGFGPQITVTTTI